RLRVREEGAVLRGVRHQRLDRRRAGPPQPGLNPSESPSSRSVRRVGTPMDQPPHPDATPWPDDHRPTAFQAAVIAAVESLGPGDLATFNEIAEEIGRPGRAQAVANVLRGAPDLPRWRVLPSDGRVYRNVARVQNPLLRAEGHHVDADRNVRAGAPSAQGSR